MWDFVTTNALGSAVAGSLLVIALGWVAKLVRDKWAASSSYSFLKSSTDNAGYTFRSTEAIAAHLKLTEQRVEYLCSRHPKIKRNTAQKQSWRIASE